jgi:hypothetical protein
VADPAGTAAEQTIDLVASFFTLSGSGVGQPPRNGFVKRCAAAAEAGFIGVGLHVDDLARTVAEGLDLSAMRADTESKVDRVADAFGGRHVSAGEFRALDEGATLAFATATDVVRRARADK